MKKFWVFVMAFAFGILAGFSIYAYHYSKIPAPARVVAKLEPPPDYLDIKGERWDIWDRDLSPDPRNQDGSHVQAATYCSERVIRYDSSTISTEAEYREAIWHEIIHAEHCGAPTPDSIEASNWGSYTHDLPEHAVVYELGMFLPGFVHDNPDFMKWAEDWK